ncbi:MAG TPA: tetratricopeptide repeat protein [Pirellulales bacterium]|nr:tetratricopeptide repeat protein [Pirellulales bacterium]
MRLSPAKVILQSGLFSGVFNPWFFIGFPLGIYWLRRGGFFVQLSASTRRAKQSDARLRDVIEREARLAHSEAEHVKARAQLVSERQNLDEAQKQLAKRRTEALAPADCVQRPGPRREIRNKAASITWFVTGAIGATALLWSAGIVVLPLPFGAEETIGSGPIQPEEENVPIEENADEPLAASGDLPPHTPEPQPTPRSASNSSNEHRSELVSKALENGTAAFQRGDYDMAIKHFSVAIKEAPLDAEPHWRRATVLIKKNRLSDARADAAHAVALAPNDPNAVFWVGYVRYKQQRYRDAMHDFDVVIKLDPMFAQAFRFRSYCHIFLGNDTAAAADMRRAMAIDPNIKDD